MPSVSRKPFISLKNVSIEVHGHVVFEDLNWELKSDEHWAVVGGNGSGRSSLMRAIARTLPITRGKITRASDDIEHVSFETQKTLLPHETFLQDRWNIGLSEDGLTVSDLLSEENINRTNRFELVRKKVDPTFAAYRRKVIEQMELKPLLKEMPIELSNGERRKTMIAQALLRKPALLILDNPFEGLDERFRTKLANVLSRLMKGHMTLIIAAADHSVIPRGITHVLRINDDHTTLHGPLKEMLVGTHTLAKLPTVLKSQSEHATRKILVRMKDVNVSYNKIPILRKVHWTIREGERWALFGPNGAGKTTLLSLILADNPQAYANDISLFGKKRGSGESIWEIKRNIGWVAPELQLYYPSDMSCLDVACSGWFDSIGLYKNCSDDQREVALASLQEFGVASRAGDSFSELSEGEQRLTLLARSMVKNPRLLILDEPCQGLDPEHRDRVIEAIDSIDKEATTIIYVTHRTDELPKSITNILHLKLAR